VVALVSSLIVMFALLALVIPFAKRRTPGDPMTWGQAMIAATYGFFLMFWAYGMVPHLWLIWADNELEWRPDALTYEYWGFAGFLEPQTLGGWFPFIVNMMHIRDLVAVGIYVAFLALNIWLWAWWNDRSKRAESARALETSDYGRPLVRKA
jgi:hypothetical protein